MLEYLQGDQTFTAYYRNHIVLTWLYHAILIRAW